MRNDNITQEIEAMYHDIVHAFNAHNVSNLLRVIDQRDDLRYVEHTQVTIGWNALRKGWEEWHSAHQNLSITPTSSYVNVLTETIAVVVTSGVMYQDTVPFQDFTWTAVFQKKDDEWKIVNAHEAFSEIAPETG